MFNIMNGKKRSLFSVNMIALLIIGAMTNASASQFRLVKDVNPGADSSNINYMSGDRQLFFWANDGSGTGKQAWTIDGAHGGVIKISNIDDTIYSHMAGKADLSVGVHQFFQLRRESDWGYELWTGTALGVTKLREIPGYVGIAQTVKALGKYFFVPSDDTVHGKELWVSDGTTAGTYMVKDIVPGSSGSNPHELTEVGDQLYFMVGDNLWQSDGIGANTRLSRSFECPACEVSDVDLVAVVNKTLYIRWYKHINGVSNYELWRYETDSGQTSKVKTFTNLPAREDAHYAGVGNILYFLNQTDSTYGSRKYGLWKTDGTSAGTTLIKEWDGVEWHIDALLTPAAGMLYFRGGNDENRELWVSNGTSQGTVQVKDINGDSANSSNLSHLTTVGRNLYFTYTLPYSITGDFWMSNGVEAGTAETDFRVDSTKHPVVINGRLYFYGGDKINSSYGWELYTDDGSSSPAVTLTPVIMYLLN